MKRTVEVGRAVLASTTRHLELWLTTLIIISPSQHWIDLEQLSSHSLLKLLSSGKAWVGRGSGMRVELSLTLRGEPFPPTDFRELLKGIVEAPIWSQLKLKPSIMADSVQDGTAHINIGYSDNDISFEERRPHRILQNVPPVDMHPPEGIPSLQLHAVRFSMDVLEPRYRSQWSRLKASPAQSHADIKHNAHETNFDARSDLMLHDLTSLVDTASSKIGIQSSLCPTPLTSRKRKRESKHTLKRTSSLPQLYFDNGIRSPVPNPGLQPTIHDVLARAELEEVQLMVDGAMRLSICGLNRSQGSLKLKANTFGVGLAEVAPVLWRPGYLAELAHRANLLPTICHAFSHAAGMKATSISLNEKFQFLTCHSLVNPQAGKQGKAPIENGSLEQRSLSIFDHFWWHLQKNLLQKPTPPLQASVVHKPETANQSDSDELLDLADGDNDERSGPTTGDTPRYDGFAAQADRRLV